MLVKINGCALIGIEAFPVKVEVNSDKGSKLFLVGLEFHPTCIKHS